MIPHLENSPLVIDHYRSPVQVLKFAQLEYQLFDWANFGCQLTVDSAYSLAKLIQKKVYVAFFPKGRRGTIETGSDGNSSRHDARVKETLGLLEITSHAHHHHLENYKRVFF